MQPNKGDDDFPIFCTFLILDSFCIWGDLKDVDSISCMTSHQCCVTGTGHGVPLRPDLSLGSWEMASKLLSV